jgi:hypothetical protein
LSLLLRALLPKLGALGLVMVGMVMMSVAVVMAVIVVAIIGGKRCGDAAEVGG